MKAEDLRPNIGFVAKRAIRDGDIFVETAKSVHDSALDIGRYLVSNAQIEKKIAACNVDLCTPSPKLPI